MDYYAISGTPIEIISLNNTAKQYLQWQQPMADIKQNLWPTNLIAADSRSLLFHFELV